MGAAVRRDDWQERLHAVIEAARGRPFCWGQHDCRTFARDCVEAVTGRVVLEGFRDYTTATGAARALRDGGFADFFEMLDAHVGERVAVPFASRGDVALVETVQGPGCAVVDLTGEGILALTPNGLARLRLSAALGVWRVG